MSDVAVITASEANGAPEVAWGDTFFYEPPGAGPEARKLPFATIVHNDYEGHDALSRLARSEVFRLNIGVGRERFEHLIGYTDPRASPMRVRLRRLDRLLPHPVYAAQGWVAILNPGERTGGLARALLAEAHEAERRRHGRTHDAHEH
jgi:hypothetical protein